MAIIPFKSVGRSLAHMAKKGAKKTAARKKTKPCSMKFDAEKEFLHSNVT